MQKGCAMKKLLIPLAVAGLLSAAGIAVSCDLDEKDASAEATPMVSKVVPVVTASKQVTTKTAAKAKAKPTTIACEPSTCDSVPPTSSGAKSAVVACEGQGCK